MSVAGPHLQDIHPAPGYLRSHSFAYCAAKMGWLRTLVRALVVSHISLVEESVCVSIRCWVSCFVVEKALGLWWWVMLAETGQQPQPRRSRGVGDRGWALREGWVFRRHAWICSNTVFLGVLLQNGHWCTVRALPPLEEDVSGRSKLLALSKILGLLLEL